MDASGAATDDARDVARRFIDAFNARDLDALRELVTDDAELRRASGEPLHGQDGVRALIAAAEDMNLRLVPLRRASVEEQDGRARVRLPVRELIGPDDIERVAELEIRDGRVAAFAVRPMG